MRRGIVRSLRALWIESLTGTSRWGQINASGLSIYRNILGAPTKHSRCTNTPIASYKTCCRPCIKLSKEACARVTRRDCVCHGAQPAQSHGCNPFCKPAFGQKSRSMRIKKRDLKYSILRLSYLPSLIKRNQNVLNKSPY